MFVGSAKPIIAPIMAHVARRAPDHVDEYIGIGHQRFDEGTLTCADFAEETEMNDARLPAGGQFPQFALRLTDIDAGGFGIAQP